MKGFKGYKLQVCMIEGKFAGKCSQKEVLAKGTALFKVDHRIRIVTTI